MPETAPQAPPAARRSSATLTKGERTAERVLDAAEPLFAEHGFAGTSLRDIADAVGIRIPSLYNHFGSKEALYASVLDRGLAPVLAMLDAAVAAAPTERLEPGQLIDAVMAVIAEHPHLSRLLLQETLSGGRRLTPVLRDRIAPIFEKAHQTVRASDPTAEWSDEEIPLLVLALYHVFVGFHAVAPLYRTTVGEDLLAADVRERQARFLTRMADRLLPSAPTRNDLPRA
jgi:TetR/AcrR family transcriptional regulator